MEQRLDLITIGVPDLVAERRFYVDGLGWTPALDLPDEVVFLQVNHGLLLALFGAQDLATDIHGASATAAQGIGNVTFAHNVGSEAEVREVIAAAERAGGMLLKPPQHAPFGGYHGYFADPAGLRWEVAHNSGWSVGPDGVVRIEPIVAPRD